MVPNLKHDLLVYLYSFVANLVSLPPAPSSAPRNVIVVNITSTTIHMSWQPPLTEDQNGVIIGYILNVTSLVMGETAEIFTESTGYILDLSAHTHYTVLQLLPRQMLGEGLSVFQFLYRHWRMVCFSLRL